MLKIKVERFAIGKSASGEDVQIPSGTYEQNISMAKGDEEEMEILRRIIAAYNNIKI
jgi:hypothetical protein